MRCSKIPDTTDVCFIDDVYHPGMSRDNVFYVNIKPYVYDIPFTTIVDRFIASGILNNDDPTSMKAYIVAFMKRYNYTYVEKDIGELAVDKAISKKILQHIQAFFNKRNKAIKQLNKQTTKQANKQLNTNSKNKTLKKRTSNEI